MRKAACFLAALALLAFVAANFTLSEPQATTSGVLANLRFEQLPNDTKKPGAPPKFTVTKKTLVFLKEYEGKTIKVSDDGSIDIEER